MLYHTVEHLDIFCLWAWPTTWKIFVCWYFCLGFHYYNWQHLMSKWATLLWKRLRTDRFLWTLSMYTYVLTRNCCQHVATCRDDMSFVTNFWSTWVTCESHDWMSRGVTCHELLCVVYNTTRWRSLLSVFVACCDATKKDVDVTSHPSCWRHVTKCHMSLSLLPSILLWWQKTIPTKLMFVLLVLKTQ